MIHEPHLAIRVQTRITLYYTSVNLPSVHRRPFLMSFNERFVNKRARIEECGVLIIDVK